MYSLGVIMIELAYWRPIKAILASSKRTGPASLEATSQAEAGAVVAGPDVDPKDQPTQVLISEDDVRGRILDPHEGILDHVQSVMGRKYRVAAETCIVGMPAFGLSDDQDQEDAVIGSLLQQEFIRVVLDELSSIVVS